jgi:hypothetical protein
MIHKRMNDFIRGKLAKAGASEELTPEQQKTLMDAVEMGADPDEVTANLLRQNQPASKFHGGAGTGYTPTPRTTNQKMNDFLRGRPGKITPEE